MTLKENTKIPEGKEKDPEQDASDVDTLFPDEKEMIEAKPPEVQEKKYRPFIEISQSDYQKLRIICAKQHEKIGETLYKIVKSWLDSKEV